MLIGPKQMASPQIAGASDGWFGELILSAVWE